METFITTFFKALKCSEEANTLRKVCLPASSHSIVDEENIVWLRFLLVHLFIEIRFFKQYYQIISVVNARGSSIYEG